MPIDSSLERGVARLARAQRIHVFGASGSGTTTLGDALANHLQVRHLDTDTYFWKQTDPPFRFTNDRADRLRLLEHDVAGLDSWVLTGSMCGWGDPLLPRITSVVFLYLKSSTRMARIAVREQQRYGRRIEPDGDMYAQHLEFMAWAESYDTALAPTRSLDLHESWIDKLRCPLIRLESDQPVEVLVHRVLDHVDECGPLN